MAYDTSKLTKLAALKALAERTKAKTDAIETRVTTLENAASEANVLEGVKVNGTALTIAEKMVDILITTGTANGAISVADADVAVKGLAALAYKANVSEADLDTALKAAIDAKAEAADVTALTSKVTTLIGSDADKSARTIANEELAKQLIPENASESLDTLQEIAAWIQEHPNDASAMNTAITSLQNLVGTLPESATSATVVDYIAEAVAASAYTHPAYTAADAALIKVGRDATGHVVIGDAVTKADITALGIPAQDTTYDIATDTEVTEMLNEVFGA